MGKADNRRTPKMRKANAKRKRKAREKKVREEKYKARTGGQARD